VEEQKRLPGQVLERDADNVPRANEPGLRVPYAPFGLEAPLPEPPVREGEALAAVVILAVLEPHQAPLLEDGAGLGHAVGNAREQLRQVERGVSIVIDPEQEHLSVQLVHMTDGTGSAKDEHLVPGRGRQPCEEFLEHLAEVGYGGHVVIEINTRRSDGRVGRELDLAESLAFTKLNLASAPSPDGTGGADRASA